MNWKRLLTLSFTAMLCFSMFSCGEYHDGGTDSNKPTTEQSGVTEGTEDNKENPSTVKLFYYENGKRTLYKKPQGISAIWRGENALHSAEFDENGTATVYNLDGDYRVTLSGLPDGYTYNPNATSYVATNYNRNVEIDLYDVIIPKSKGTNMYTDYILLSDETKNAVNPYVYRVSLESAETRVHCQFSPPSQGLYSVESWVDVQDQTIDPNIDVYTGSFAAKYFSYTLEDGGVSKGYTSNFKHEVDILAEEVGNDFSFAVFAGVKNDKYPVTIDFVVHCDGEPIRNTSKAEMIVPSELNGRAKNYSKSLYKITNSETKSGSRWLFDGSKYAYNEETGYYHVYNKDVYKGYFETYSDGSKSDVFADGYGPILYAEVKTDKDGLYPFMDYYYPPGVPAFTPQYGTPMGISTCELMSNELTLKGTKNYRFFINGWSGLHNSDQWWIDQLSKQELAKYSKMEGYAAYTNSDCCYPVTNELQLFLQEFSQTKEYFADGEGRAEDYGYDSTEEDQWLFACRYYQPITIS